jgi:hypothetical protein
MIFSFSLEEQLKSSSKSSIESIMSWCNLLSIVHVKVPFNPRIFEVFTFRLLVSQSMVDRFFSIEAR